MKGREGERPREEHTLCIGLLKGILNTRFEQTFSILQKVEERKESCRKEFQRGA